MLAKADELNTKQVGEEFLRWGAGGLYKHLILIDGYIQTKKGKLRDLVIDKYADLLDRYRERFREIEAVEEENFAKMYVDIIQAGELLGVKIPQGMLASMRTIAIYKSWVTYLDPDYHFMRDVYRDVLASINKKYMYNEDEVTVKPVILEEAVEDILEWVSRIAEKDYPWYQSVSAHLGKLYA